MRNKRNKTAALALCLCLCVFALAGCGQSAGSEGSEGGGADAGDVGETRVITFSGWGSLAEKKNFTRMIAEFTEAHPNIKVNYQHVPGTQSDYLVKLISNLAAGKMPDVFYIHSDEFHAWAKAGRLLDLSAYLETSELYADGLVWDKSLSVFRFDPQTGEIGAGGGLYGLPKDLGPWAMVYNKTLFEQEGVPFPDPVTPMTWTAFTEVAKRLTEGDGISKIYGTANYTLESAVWSNGADFLSDDKKTVTVDTPAFAEAMQFVADLALVHGVSPTPDETAAGDWFSRWVNGKVAMAWMGPWDQATFWDAVTFDWDIMPAPASPRTGESVTWLASAALCISPDSKNKDAAYALAEFLCMDREAQTFNYESGQAVPNIVSMAKNEFLAMDRPPQNRQIFLDIIEDEEKGRFKPTYYTEDNTWSTYFWTESSKVWSGGMRAADFCRAIQPDMQERLDSK